LIEGPAIIVGRKGSAGAVHFLTGPSWPIDTVYFTHGHEGLDLKYWAHYLSHLGLASLDRSTAIPGLSRDDYSVCVVPVPPANEQRRIVSAIEEHLSRLDAAVAGLKLVQAQLPRYRAAVLKAAIDDSVAEGATSVTSTTLGELATLITSGSRGWAAHYSAAGPLFIRAQDIRTDHLVLGDVAHVTPPNGAEGRRTRVAAGDLLVTITGANVTKSALVERDIGEAYVSQHVALIRLTEPRDAEYVFLWLISPSHGRRDLERMAYGAGKPGLNLTQLRELRLTLPMPEVQNRVVTDVAQRMSIVAASDKVIQVALKRAERLRQAILHRAFAGQLVLQDPNDEPASVLLERIPAARASQPSRRHAGRRAKPAAMNR
jgi:type I restriction enzyme S subunit